MIQKADKNLARKRRHLRVRKKLFGTAQRPRLSVFRSHKHIYAQLIDDVGPDVTREWISELPSYETTFDGDLVDAMNDAILAVDPEGRTVPYMLSGGTDAKAFARLGIRCFGFAPLRLPPPGAPVWKSGRQYLL